MPGNTGVSYDESVFVNCPFDQKYANKWLRLIIFTILACRFYPRTALEIDNAAAGRYQNILELIKQSRFGIHDLSNVGLGTNDLPRFNMPFELGLFLAAREFGDENQSKKSVLVLEQVQYQTKKCLSDIGGADPKCYKSEKAIIKQVRDWLNNYIPENSTVEGHLNIYERYKQFKKALPGIAISEGHDVKDLAYKDLLDITAIWLQYQFTR